MSGMTCDVTGCKWNDGNGGCDCDGIYISDGRVSRGLIFSGGKSEKEIK